MGTSLLDKTPQDTYTGLIKTTDNSAITSTLKLLTDGAGNDSKLEISTSQTQILGTGTDSTQIGKASASNTASIAIGRSVTSSGVESTGIGRNITASAAGSVCIGNYSQATDDFAISIGRSCSAKANDGIAIGTSALVDTSHNSSVAIGKGATTTASNQLALGSSATNLGTITSESVTSDATWTVKINGTDYKILLKA